MATINQTITAAPLEIYELSQAAYDSLVQGGNISGKTLNQNALYLTTTDPVNFTIGTGSNPWLRLIESNGGTNYNYYFQASGKQCGIGPGWNYSLKVAQTGDVTTAGVLYGAAWNDYAEYRNQEDFIPAGYCVKSSDEGKVSKTNEKLQACDGIVSDTFGFAIGKTDICQTPLAVAGRALAYFEGGRENYHAGDTVCASENGKVMKMTREEIKEWPDRIVGIVSEIPNYEEWGPENNKIKVNNRIWIKIK